jgi:hypothetical protein
MTLKDKLLALKLIKEFDEGKFALFKDGSSVIITIPAFQNIAISIPTISFDAVGYKNLCNLRVRWNPERYRLF